MPKDSEKNENTIIDDFAKFKKLYRGFDPENEQWDRRLLYEVTGVRMSEQEFRESDTSDDEKEEVERPERQVSERRESLDTFKISLHENSYLKSRLLGLNVNSSH